MADGTVQRWTCSDGDAGAEMWRDNVDGAYVLYSDYVAAVIAVRTSLIEAGRDAGCFLSDEVSNEFLSHVPAEIKAHIAALSWRLITPDNQPKPYAHEVWGLHVGIKVVEPWMPDVYAAQGGWNGAGYTHMRLLNIPMPEKGR